jgi:hypothetical protein
MGALARPAGIYVHYAGQDNSNAGKFPLQGAHDAPWVGGLMGRSAAT